MPSNQSESDGIHLKWNKIWSNFLGSDFQYEIGYGQNSGKKLGTHKEIAFCLKSRIHISMAFVTDMWIFKEFLRDIS